jgi:hypothetical protein
MKKVYFILFTMLFIGCKENNKAKDNGLVVEIDIHQSQKKDISAYLDSVRYIQLQTTDDNLIGYISKVFFTDDRMIVVDGSEEQILIFDYKGVFLNKIKRKGQGPGEYTGISRGLFDTVHKNIMVYGGRKMLFYNMDGEFIREIPHFNNSAIIRDVVNLPNGNFLCYTYDLTPEKVGYEASGLWEVDALGNFIRSFFTYEKLYPVRYNYDNSYFVLLPDEKISLMDQVNDNIYHYENGNLQKYISYDVKHNKRYELEGQTYTEENYIISLSSQDKGNYIFTMWSETMKENFCSVFSKEDKNTVLIYPAKNFWSEHKVVEPLGYGFVDSNKSDVLLTAISGDAILTFMKEKNASPDIKGVLQEMVKGMSEDEIVDMNPILQLLYIK